MALFGLGKKTEDKRTPACACSGGCQTTEALETASGCCAEEKNDVCCIKVLGTGCPSCHALLENTKEAVKAMGLTLEVDYVTDLQKIMGYGVMSMPALVVNDKVVSMGKVLKAPDVEKQLHRLGY